MTENMKTILAGFTEFILAALIAACVVGCIYFDVTINQNILEDSFVEFAQEWLLLGTTALFAMQAAAKRQGGLWLVSGFFGCMFIRELDAYFDMIVHGAWKYFALMVVAFVFFKAWRMGKENTIASLAAFMKTRSFVFIFIGLLIVLVYSRLFGMGELWHSIMTDNFNRTVKNVVEEGSELWGYALVFWGAVKYWLAAKLTK